MALSNSYYVNNCNLIALFLINSNDDLPYIIRFVNFVVLTFDSTIPFGLIYFLMFNKKSIRIYYRYIDGSVNNFIYEVRKIIDECKE